MKPQVKCKYCKSVLSSEKGLRDHLRRMSGNGRHPTVDVKRRLYLNGTRSRLHRNAASFADFPNFAKVLQAKPQNFTKKDALRRANEEIKARNQRAPISYNTMRRLTKGMDMRSGVRYTRVRRALPTMEPELSEQTRVRIHAELPLERKRIQLRFLALHVLLTL